MPPLEPVAAAAPAAPAAIVLAVLAGSLVLLLTDTLRYDLVALLVVLALAVSGALSPAEAFAGFASEPVIVIACLSLFGHALTRWGVGETLSQRLLSGPALRERGLVLRIALISAVLAAVMSDVAVVGIMIPMVGGISRSRGIPMARLLMPISFGAFLGDLLLVIGSAKNLAVNGVLAQHGARTFAMFDFTHYGLAVLGMGVLYLAGPGRRLLPRRPSEPSLSERYKVPRFVTEVLVEPSSTLINRNVSDIDLFGQRGITVLGIVRAGGEGTILAPGPYNRIRRDDTLVLQGEPESLVRLRTDLGLRERASVGEGERRLDSADVQLVEAVVLGGSMLAGRTLAEADFRERTGLNVLAIAKEGEVQPTSVAQTPLDVGDTLLIQGHLRDLERARRERDLIVLSEVPRPLFGRGAKVSIALLAGVLAASLLDLMPLHVAALAGALGLVLTGCVPAKDIYRHVDWLVMILIGGMLALGKAFEKHGLAESLAEQISSWGRAFSTPHVVLALLLATATLLAQTTTSIATAVILTPVALSLATQLGVDDRAFVMAVLTGTNCAFTSPVAHPANAMVVGPGAYRYRDFLRVGGPLTLLILALAMFLLPLLWPFHAAS
jgi:di/tricarboxylate transporter